MNDLISIIIPFFNSEKTIEKCINSILNQTYTNFEVILIDNSSTDSSKEKINKYLTKYSFMRYYNIKKQNISLARNKGLKEAKGNFICFVDSDDQIHNNYLKKLHSILGESEMSVCSYSTNIKRLSLHARKHFIVTKNKMLNSIIKNRSIYGYVWNKMFRTSIIKNNELKFNENLKIGEDIDFVFEYLKYCQNISISKSKLYYYNKSQLNTVNNIDNYKYTLDSWKNMFAKYEKLNLNKVLKTIYYYYFKKYYEIKYYKPSFEPKNLLELPHKLSLFLKFKLFLYKNFTILIIFSKKVRDRI